MSSVCLYFQVHQPFRLRPYTVFDIGQAHHYEDADMNCDILLRVAQKCYLPMNDLLLQLIRKHKKRFKVSFSISGVCLEQFDQHAPEVIDSFRALAETGCVEFLGETHHHSLAFLYSPEEFAVQAGLHARRIHELFGQKPRVFRNSELIYNNDLARFVEGMGYAAILAEGADHVLGWRSPNFAYLPAPCNKMKLLLKNYSLSDDIAFRFSNTAWSEYPLTAQKYAAWLHSAAASSDVVNLFMDYETFGEHHWEGTGIFDFMRVLPEYILARPGMRFATLSEAAGRLTPAGRLDVPQFMSWADAERDLTAWNGNDMQCDALEALYHLEARVKASANEDLLMVWRRLQTSDHFYYMCTKWFADGDVHKYFNPYASPYDAYINFMNVLGDFELTLQQAAPSSLAGRESVAWARAGAPEKKAGSARAKAEKKSAPAKAAPEKQAKSARAKAEKKPAPAKEAAKKTSAGKARAEKK
ncbi:MAG: alpha-amylase [Deltaproteobacteria bacterium]|jgi:alpha-amylase|nr:alpha-amylase [Deltaproteobacteria bacterium]